MILQKLRMYGASALSLLALICSSFLSAAEGGVILVYHHVSDSTPAITSVSPSQFQLHLNYLEENDFAVVSLTQLLDSISQNIALPDRAIAISFDDAYESVFTSAFPLLQRRNWPFSVFVSTEAVDKGYDGFMTWDQLREVSEYGAEIGGHSVSHAHLIRQSDAESRADWFDRVTEEIDQGNQRIEEEVGEPVRLFAYPYGEFNADLEELLEERGIYGLAQQSGAVGDLTDMQAIPRYPMAQGFARMERFELVANSKALPVISVNSGERVRTAGQRTGDLSFKLQEGDYQINNLACYSSSGEALEISREEFSVSVELPRFSPGRNKVNCTAPSASESGVYYWFSQQWVVKTSEEKWSAE